MAIPYRIIYSYHAGGYAQSVYLKLLGNDQTQAVLFYKRIDDCWEGLFDDERPVYSFSTNVKLDDIRDLYLALSTGDDIARSFYSVDEDTLILVNVDDGLATMKIVTADGEEITPDFDPPMDDVSCMQHTIRRFLEEVE